MNDALIDCQSMSARAHVLAAAGPAPYDCTHPFNEAMGHLLLALNRSPVASAAEILLVCNALCRVLRIMGRDEEYCRWYEQSLAALLASVGILPPAGATAWQRLLLPGGGE